MKSLVSYINVPSDATTGTFKLKYNMLYAIPLEDMYEFVLIELPSEYELKKIYEYNFVLNEITEDGYYVFIKEEYE